MVSGLSKFGFHQLKQKFRNKDVHGGQNTNKTGIHVLRKAKRVKRNKIAPNISHRKELIRLIVFPFLLLLFYFILLSFFFFFASFIVVLLFFLFLPFPSVAHCVFFICVGSYRKLGQHIHTHARIRKSNKLFWILANIVNNSCGIAFESWRRKSTQTNAPKAD